MYTKVQLLELCNQKGVVLIKQANDFIQKGMIKQFQNEPCSRVEYDINSRYMPRGFYCPSIALDKIITNARRGNLLKHLTQRSKPTHRFVFDESEKLIMAETKAPFPEITEYLIYEYNKILGFSVDANNRITAISEENYEQGFLMNYYFATLSFDEKSIHSAFYEQYHYINDELNMIDHISVPIFSKKYLKIKGVDSFVKHWQLTKADLN